MKWKSQGTVSPLSLPRPEVDAFIYYIYLYIILYYIIYYIIV